VVRAVERLRDEAGIRAGATIRLIKRIPSAAGLGGASSDAAAAIMAANAVWKLGWPRERLMQLAAGLGSDVPFFFGSVQPSVAGGENGSSRCGSLRGCTSSWFDLPWD